MPDLEKIETVQQFVSGDGCPGHASSRWPLDAKDVAWLAVQLGAVRSRVLTRIPVTLACVSMARGAAKGSYGSPPIL
jgi:hypothetical protein